MDSPCPVQDTAPLRLSAYPPAPGGVTREAGGGGGTFSMTARARDTGLAMFCTQDTAPQPRVLPSMMTASSSTAPSAFSTAPCPVAVTESHTTQAQLNRFTGTHPVALAGRSLHTVHGGLGQLIRYGPRPSMHHYDGFHRLKPPERKRIKEVTNQPHHKNIIIISISIIILILILIIIMKNIKTISTKEEDETRAPAGPGSPTPDAYCGKVTEHCRAGVVVELSRGAVVVELSSGAVVVELSRGAVVELSSGAVVVELSRGAVVLSCPHHRATGQLSTTAPRDSSTTTAPRDSSTTYCATGQLHHHCATGQLHHHCATGQLHHHCATGQLHHHCAPPEPCVGRKTYLS
ncbi:LOW QUALITY PROTEIN: hypothetical protein CRUP_016451 [Coryphaenoides rupestris]|nr:LOW QUALITY PROTEIN: hypothetical protein CRUP_016451 [Coryphaenoides rupestris]